MDTILSPLKTEYLNGKGNGISEKHVRVSFPDEYQIILDKYKEYDIPFNAKLYLYVNDMSEPPRCEKDGCHNPAAFATITKGFRRYCSQKCCKSDPEFRKRAQQTCLEKYGVKNILQSEDFKNKIKQTNLEKYGVENVFASSLIKERIKSHYNEKYGVDYPSQSAEIQETRKQNSIKKYGVDHHMKVEEIKNKITNTNRLHALESVNGLLGYEDVDGERMWVMECPHQECIKCQERTYLITSDQCAARKTFGIEPCTRLLPIKQSHSSGTTFELFIRNILDNAGIEYKTNNREVLGNKKELDIYIPSHKLAIECNGLPWHATVNGKGMNYHVDKFVACRDKGIQLLMFWYDQFIHHPDIIESIILSKLGIYKRRFGARECKVREIDSTTSTQFLINNHIQGRTNAAVRLGLFKDNELVGVMTFAKRSKLSGGQKSGDQWELNRFCTLLQTQVIGGAGKLLKYFIRKYNPETIASFSSNDVSNGGLYEKLGFVKVGDITTAYWYISHKEYIRYHRTNFTKSRLKEMGYDIENKTESEIMAELPYFKIYDSGHIKYILYI